MVVQLELLADKLRKWDYKYAPELTPERATYWSPSQLARIHERHEKLPKIIDELEHCALELYGLW